MVKLYYVRAECVITENDFTYTADCEANILAPNIRAAISKAVHYFSGSTFDTFNIVLIECKGEVQY